MDSYPPHLLRLPGSAPGSRARGRVAAEPAAPVAAHPAGQQGAPPALLASPGTPGTYQPAIPPRDRPRNVTQLDMRVQPATPEPWPAGAYVPIGESGRRAHWTGTGWKGGESPGYAAGQVVTIGNRSESEQTEGQAQ